MWSSNSLVMRLGFVWTQEQNDDRHWSTQTPHFILQFPLYDIKVGVCCAMGGRQWVLHCKKMQQVLNTCGRYCKWAGILHCIILPQSHCHCSWLCKKCCNPCRKHTQWKCCAPAHILNSLRVVPTTKQFILCVRKRHFNVHKNLKVLSVSDHKPCTESIFHCPPAHHRAENVAV